MPARKKTQRKQMFPEYWRRLDAKYAKMLAKKEVSKIDVTIGRMVALISKCSSPYIKKIQMIREQERVFLAQKLIYNFDEEQSLKSEKRPDLAHCLLWVDKLLKCLRKSEKLYRSGSEPELALYYKVVKCMCDLAKADLAYYDKDHATREQDVLQGRHEQILSREKRERVSRN